MIKKLADFGKGGVKKHGVFAGQPKGFMKKAQKIKRFRFKQDNSYKRVAKYFETRYKVISLHEASGACFDCAICMCKILMCFLFFLKRI